MPSSDIQRDPKEWPRNNKRSRNPSTPRQVGLVFLAHMSIAKLRQGTHGCIHVNPVPVFLTCAFSSLSLSLSLSDMSTLLFVMGIPSDLGFFH